MAQYLARRPIDREQLLQYAVVGTFVWVLVGFLSIVYLFLAASSYLKRSVEFMPAIAISLSLSGISTGVVVALLRQDRSSTNRAERLSDR